MSVSLTTKQKRLIEELHELTETLCLDFPNIQHYKKAERTTRLEVMKRHLVRGEVVHRYTLVDEEMAVVLAHYFFGSNADFICLWKTKKFKYVNYYVLEVLSLMEKLRFVREILPLHKSVIADIERLNNLRNGIAHSYFPENLRSAKPTWKGKDIFSVGGLKAFQEDMHAVHRAFTSRRSAMRAKRSSDTSPSRSHIAAPTLTENNQPQG